MYCSAGSAHVCQIAKSIITPAITPASTEGAIPPTGIVVPATVVPEAGSTGAAPVKTIWIAGSEPLANTTP